MAKKCAGANKDKESGGKQRLDALIVQRGLAQSREQAQRFILAGQVQVEGVANPKPGLSVAAETAIIVTGFERYVSRGGVKLEAALKEFGIHASGKICADIGASTGGFTDCLLQHDAARVYAVDVGKSQMHDRIRNDHRVVLIERANARDLRPDQFAEAPRLLCVDLSFISLSKVLSPLAKIAADGAEAIVLVKPQFEATRQEVSRGKGIIKDEAIHARALREVIAAANDAGWDCTGQMDSPIKGGSGNREFLLHLNKRA